MLFLLNTPSDELIVLVLSMPEVATQELKKSAHRKRYNAEFSLFFMLFIVDAGVWRAKAAGSSPPLLTQAHF
ncbi:hypothetical protein O71_02002 [Pontibacter sp. BAB1700]|nr:hypothetical protein O71_02002 [Pontibacter sp. BAB1700]